MIHSYHSKYHTAVAHMQNTNAISGYNITKNCIFV